MWISGLDALRTPLLHLHTQANVALPWADIDMDFMNLNQAAHGDREFGYIQTRLGVRPQDGRRARQRPARRSTGSARGRGPPAGCAELRSLRLARFGDNMRDVAVTEGDKVEAQLRFGVSVNTYGVNDLVDARRRRSPTREVDDLVKEYDDTYRLDARAARRRRTARLAAVRGPHRAGPARVPRRGRLPGVHHELRGPRRPAAAAGPRGAAADGRRLRLRRRGRLEDLGAGTHAQGDGASACRAAPPSWRTTPTT